MKFIKNVKEFAMRGSVVDMGVGVVIGTAFAKIVDSLVTDIIMPPIGLILGKVNFSNLYINLSSGQYRSLVEAKEDGAVTINYGVFIDSIIHFAIVAFATYCMIVQVNRIRKAPAEALSSKECPYCFTNIPTRALRCPHCTTVLKEEEKIDEKKGDGTLEVIDIKTSTVRGVNDHVVKINLK